VYDKTMVYGICIISGYSCHGEPHDEEETRERQEREGRIRVHSRGTPDVSEEDSVDRILGLCYHSHDQDDMPKRTGATRNWSIYPCARTFSMT
jgi:hypothetical protein